MPQERTPRHRVIVTRQLPPGGLDPLGGPDVEIVQRPEDTPYSHDELVEAARDAEAILSLLTDRIDAEVLAAGAAGHLRVVSNAAVGFDNIDLAAARQHGIMVCNTPKILDATTADLAFLLILAASRRASEAEADLRAGRWQGWGISDHLGRDVHGAVLGLVGYGRIGRDVARRAAGFDMTVLHHTRTPTGEPGFRATLDELLEESDVVSLHVPLTQDTFHMIGAPQLAKMKPGAVLVNTARGPVVDEEALADALESGRLFGAGLDVFDGEPTVSARLLQAPHTVLLPHIGSATVQTRRAMVQMAAQAIRAVLDGRTPDNTVN